MGDHELPGPIQDAADNAGSMRRLRAQLTSPLRIVPFVGAGLSTPFGFPTWKTFLRNTARPYGLEGQIDRHLASNQYEEAAQALLDAIKPAAFHAAVEDAFGRHHLAGQTWNGAVAVLPRLASGPVITTNFDRVLESAYAAQGTAFADVALGAQVDRTAAALYRDAHVLLKLHGDANERTGRVLTLKEYAQAYGGATAAQINYDLPLPTRLGQMLTSRTLLFLGCSLEGDRTTAIMAAIAVRYQGAEHFAVVARPPTPQTRLAQVAHLSSLGIHPLWYPAGHYELIEPFLAYLADLLGGPGGAGGPGAPPPSGPPPVNLSRNRRLTGPDDPLLRHTTAFFGRREEVPRVLGLLQRAAGLVTVTAAPGLLNVNGAPGIGKTEICKQVLRQTLAASPEQRVYCVELAEANDEAGLRARLAEALDVAETTERAQLLGALQAAADILYLDNLEDVLADAAARQFIQEIGALPGLRVLASSRETLPGMARNVAIESLDLDAAVALFRQEWDKSARSGAALADSAELREFLNQDLSCHALSIVLVAAQGYQHATLAALRAAWRAEHVRLAKLPRDGNRRLTSLEVSLSGSLLAVQRELPVALTLWGIMGLFPEGLSPAAWAAVAAALTETPGEPPGPPAAAAAMRELLIRLNVVSVDNQNTLRMLAPLRQFILDRSRRGEHELSVERLVERAFPYFLALASEMEAHSQDGEHVQTLDALLAEYANLHFFLLVAAPLRDAWPQALSQLSDYLRNTYQLRVLLGREMLQALIPAQQQAGLRSPLAQSTKILGDLARRLGDLDGASAAYSEAAALYRQERSNLGLANTIQAQGDLARHLGDVDGASAAYSEAAALFRLERDNLGLANTIKAQGDLARHLGDVDSASAAYSEAAALYRLERSNLGLANTIQAQGDLAREGGALEQAKARYLTARNLYISERANMGLGYTCCELARVTHALGDLAARDRFLAEAAVAAAASGTPSVVSYQETVRRELLGRRRPAWVAAVARWVAARLLP